MKHFSVLILAGMVLFFSQNTFAKIAVCEKAIEKKYSGKYKDRYGNVTINEIAMLNYTSSRSPGEHQWGNNTAHRYVAVIHIMDGRKTDIATAGIWCLVNSAGKVLDIKSGGGPVF